MPSLSPKIEGPVHPTRKEYPQFLKFLSQCYGFSDPRWFENDTEVFFGTQPAQLKTKWALKIGGRFAAHVGIFPFTSLVEGRPLKVAGIGAVATHPDFRGQGLMKRLMDHVEREIEKDGYDLSILWGERALYRPYGYERGLFMDQFTFLKRSLQYFAVANGVRRAKPGDSSVMQRLYHLHSFRTQRTPAYFSSIMRRFNQYLTESTWVLEKKGKVSAYAVFGKPLGGGLEAAEWGGETEDVACLWSSVLQRIPQDSFNAMIGPDSGLYGWAMENVANQIRTCHSCMIKPLNLLRILKAFEPQLQKRYMESGVSTRRTFILNMEGGQTAAVELGSRLKISTSATRGISVKISLSDCVRLLFGVGRPSEALNLAGEEEGLLDHLFPLQWYWWRSDWI